MKKFTEQIVEQGNERLAIKVDKLAERVAESENREAINEREIKSSINRLREGVSQEIKSINKKQDYILRAILSEIREMKSGSADDADGLSSN